MLALTATFEALTLLVVGFYFLFVTKDWRYWYYGVIVIQLVIIAGLVWLPESPDFLFAKGRFEESREVLHKIAKFNGKDVKPE